MIKMYAVFTFRKPNNSKQERIFRRTEVDDSCTTPVDQGQLLNRMITVIETEPKYRNGQVFFESMKLREE